MTEYVAIIESGESGVSAYLPDVPGCVAAGDTAEEAVKLLQEALVGHLEVMRESGEELPEPRSRASMVSVSSAAA